MRRLACCVGAAIFIVSLCALPTGAQNQPIPPPPKVREKSKAIYPLYPAYVHTKMVAVDEIVPVRYEIGGKQYRRWGYPAKLQVLEMISLPPLDAELDAVVPGYTIKWGPERTDWYERRKNFTKLKAGLETYLALQRHVDGYWLVQEVLNRHDFAELKMIGERVVLTGTDDTIGIKKSSFRLHMNPLQKAYYEARKKVTAGQMTEQELRQQFTEEMIEAVFDPNNADLVLGKE